MHFPSRLLIYFFLLSFTILSYRSFAQYEVRVRVINEKEIPVPSATVMIKNALDSNEIYHLVTDSMGWVKTEPLNEGRYHLTVSSVNYLMAEKGITVKDGSTEFIVVLASADNKLAGVVVTASRPLIRQEDDKTIVDPEQLAAASTNAYEIIEKTPGLFVDQDGNIYLNSTTPATVYINGREQKMSAADIATMLKNLPPNAIASIEILRTPSARYDASGSGGIVNVVLKKGVRIGLTGSVTLGGNQGTYGNQFVGLNLSNNNGRLTTYLNLQAGTRNNSDQIITKRYFVADSLLGQEAFTKYASQNFYVGYGFSYELSKKWEMSYDGRLSKNPSENRSSNLSLIRSINSSIADKENNSIVENDIVTSNFNQGLNFKYKIDSLGSEWTTDLSYNFTPGNTEQHYQTIFIKPSYPTIFGEGDIENRLHFFSAQTNFLKKLKGNITTEMGVKTTNVKFSNNTEYFTTFNGTQQKDEQRTKSYEYREKIHAAYVQASKNFSGFILKVGTRLENTNMIGDQLIPKDTSFSLNRTDLFPYIYLSRGIMKIAGYELRAYLVFRRTINRPAYEYLNPSLRFVDPYLVETGNPTLRPQFTKNYEANISVDERPIIAIGLNQTSDIFTQVIYQADTSSQLAIRTYDNLGSNKEVYFRALGAIPPGKKYFFVAGGQYNHNFYEGLYENKPLSFKKGTWTIFTYHQLKITPNTQLSLHGFARFKGQMQFYELSKFGSLNMSLTRHFLNRKLSITLSVQDILYTNQNEFTLQQGSVKANGSRKSDSRRIGLNIRYSFGVRKKEETNIFNIEPGDRIGQ